MSGHFEGIGAQLEERRGHTKVKNIITGSASYKQGQLKGGDIILKVAQGGNPGRDSGYALIDVVN